MKGRGKFGIMKNSFNCRNSFSLKRCFKKLFFVLKNIFYKTFGQTTFKLFFVFENRKLFLKMDQNTYFSFVMN